MGIANVRFRAVAVAAVLTAGVNVSILPINAASETRNLAVGSQYDTTHVYVAPEDFDRFVASLVATFGGTSSKRSIVRVTPTASSTISQLVLTPTGTISAFGFRTSIPYPFGSERTGYMVTDLDAAISAARAAGADVLVAPFNDPIGRDAIIQWPGGVNTQLYWHTKPSSYTPLETIPENRIYVSPDRAGAFIQSYLAFTRGRIISDDARAPGAEIGQPNGTYRRIRIESAFGKAAVLVTDGHLRYPYGRETTGYEVGNLAETLAKAKRAGATILVTPYRADRRSSAVVSFPGGYIAEIHSAAE